MKEKYNGLIYSEIVDKVLEECAMCNYSKNSIKEGMATLNELKRFRLSEKNKAAVIQATYFLIIREMLSAYRISFDEYKGQQLINKIDAIMAEYSFDDEYGKGFNSLKEHMQYTLDASKKLKAINPDMSSYNIDSLEKDKTLINSIISNELIDKKLSEKYQLVIDEINYRIEEIEEKYFKPEIDLQKTDTTEFDYFTEYPMLLDEDFEKERIINLISPIPNEALFIAYKNVLGMEMNPKFYNLGMLDHISIPSINYFFKSLESNDIVIIYNFEELLSEEKTKAVIMGITKAYQANKKIIIVSDNKIIKNGKLSFKLIDLLSLNEKINVRKQIIALPSYEKISEKLTSLGMTSEDDIYIRADGLYLGYYGFNKLMLNANSPRKKLLMLLNKIADNHANDVSKFINTLEHIYVFVTKGWVYQEVRPQLNYGDNHSNHYDYDQLPEFSLSMFHYILDNKALNIWAKCGLAVEYSLTLFADKIVYESLLMDEKKERVKLAIQVLTKILLLPNPTIKYISSDTINGSCIDGGRGIEINSKIVPNISELMHTLFHECFHSLQHNYSLNAQFYYDNLGINEERNKYWMDNLSNEKYISASKYNQNDLDNANIKLDVKSIYSNQTVEVDANVFASECIAQANACRYLINNRG